MLYFYLKQFLEDSSFLLIAFPTSIFILIVYSFGRLLYVSRNSLFLIYRIMAFLYFGTMLITLTLFAQDKNYLENFTLQDDTHNECKLTPQVSADWYYKSIISRIKG
jgi:hypothetical protein